MPPSEVLRSVHRGVQLALRFRHLLPLRFKGSPAHVSALAGTSTRLVIRPVMRASSGRRPGPAALAFLLPFSRRHSLPGHPVPPGASAPLTIGLPPRLRIPVPARRTLARFTRSARMRPRPAGLSLYPGDSGAHRPSRHPRPSPAASQRRSLPPRRHNPARDVIMTRHQQEFPGSGPTGPSPHLWPPWLGRRPLGFSVSFAPSRSGTGHARHGGDRPSTTCSYVPGISQTSSTSSLTTCDLVSQCRFIPAHLRDCPTSRVRSSQAYRLSVP